MCYDTNDKTNTEIVSDEDVRAYNKTTINGNICKIQNIFVDEQTLYFLGTPESSEILKYDLDGNK